MIYGWDGQPDYEAMILERQEEQELLEDCSGECDYCRYKVEVRLTGLGGEYIYRCGLVHDEM